MQIYLLFFVSLAPQRTRRSFFQRVLSNQTEFPIEALLTVFQPRENECDRSAPSEAGPRPALLGSFCIFERVHMTFANDEFTASPTCPLGFVPYFRARTYDP